MKGKVTCQNCGWSWNKSDSSKKDMYICHECGKDNSNNMENGGWLDNYANGGTMQEYQENYNDSSVSLPKGFVGMGYDTKGRNYSPAWGGSFQGGGSVYPVNYFPEAQGGMSLPGATGHMYARYEQGGDVDFSYPRTKGIPSNGPYAKKTKASAQNGSDIYGSPIIAKEVRDSNISRSQYDPRLNRMTLGSDYDTWADKDKLRAHENFHAKQYTEGRTNYDIAHHTDDEQWMQMQKRPEMMSTDAVWNNFYNRNDIENNQDYDNYINYDPESRFLNREVLFNKVLDKNRYYNPFSLEGEAMYYEETGKEFSPFTFELPKDKNGGWLDSYEDGGVIKDDMGQWNHPGEITEIGSNDITMEGVPYDVLGISDTGDTKLMKPGKNYKFKGKKVTEYPMAQNGLRQEQKGLVNLDQLTNFTNYNKPQPGGWLNKYN